MNKKFVSGVLLGSFLVFEIGEADGHVHLYRVTKQIVGSAPEAVAEQTHTHSELNLDEYVDVSSPFVSGGQADHISYRLHLKPVADSTAVNAIGLLSWGGQPMFGKFENIDVALQALKANFGLPDVQLQGIRKTLDAGGESEVGAVRFRLGFQEAALWELGLTFRLLTT
jgi:hypothetical protein